MATKEVYVNKTYNRQEIQNLSYEKLAADPVVADLFEGRFWFNTTEHRLKHYNNSAICSVAYLKDLANIGQFQGAHDATSGVPTGVDLSAGDFWRVSVAGTIAGIVGEGDLEPNDVVYALVDNPLNPADFSSVQANTNHSGLGIGEETTVNLVAGVALTVTPSNFSGNIHSWEVLNSTGAEIEVDVKKNNLNNTLNITSNVALTNVLVNMIGVN